MQTYNSKACSVMIIAYFESLVLGQWSLFYVYDITFWNKDMHCLC